MTFIPALVRDNRILLERDPGYVSNLRALPMVERERLLFGNWNIRWQAGNYFRREWFGTPLDTVPADIIARCRFWDRAASEQKSGTDPDATVGLLVTKTRQGLYVIEDCVKLYASPHQVEREMAKCAKRDGPQTIIGFMCDPGSAGKYESASASRALDGCVIKIIPASGAGNKETRARPVSSQCEAGNVKLVRASWNDEFLRVLENFPAGRHDDEVDGLSGAHQILSEETGGWDEAAARTVLADNPQLRVTPAELDREAARAPYRLQQPGAQYTNPLSRMGAFTPTHHFTPRKLR
jgi:predicted phage terminase large subunit-like protein